MSRVYETAGFYVGDSMSEAGKKLTEIYELLFKRFGQQGWWPGESKDEIIVGAILTQNTNWQNVERAISNLKNADLMSLKKLHKVDLASLAALIRPAGYYNIKAKRLKNFLDWFFIRCSGSFEQAAAKDTQSFREELLSINGIGRETADSILLYAFQRPVFVVDAYTHRIAVRHGLIDADSDYELMRGLFEDNLPSDERLFNEFHALLVQTGKNFCRPRPQCGNCPLFCLPHTIEERF